MPPPSSMPVPSLLGMPPMLGCGGALPSSGIGGGGGLEPMVVALAEELAPVPQRRASAADSAAEACRKFLAATGGL